MNIARTSVLLSALAVTAFPAIAQQSATPDSSGKSVAASVDYAALRDNLSGQNKVLNGDVAAQRALLKKNQDLLKEAQRLDAANKKMLAEKQRMIQQNAELEKQRAALAQAQGQTTSQSSDSTIAKAEAK